MASCLTCGWPVASANTLCELCRKVVGRVVPYCLVCDVRLAWETTETIPAVTKEEMEWRFDPTIHMRRQFRTTRIVQPARQVVVRHTNYATLPNGDHVPTTWCRDCFENRKEAALQQGTPRERLYAERFAWDQASEQSPVTMGGLDGYIGWAALQTANANEEIVRKTAVQRKRHRQRWKPLHPQPQGGT